MRPASSRVQVGRRRETNPLAHPLRALILKHNVPAILLDNSSGTLFQESTGETPASYGDVVGLGLDRSQGLARGPELWDVADVTFSGAGWSYEGAGVWIHSGTVLGELRVDGKLTEGHLYRCNFETLVAGYAQLQLGGFADGVNSAFTTVPAVIDKVLPALNLVLNSIRITTSIDGMRVRVSSTRELKGNHLTQATTAAKPLLFGGSGGVGPEIFTNGDGSTSDVSGYTIVNDATVAIVNGETVITAGVDANGYVYMPVSVVAGKSYILYGEALGSTGTAANHLTIWNADWSQLLGVLVSGVATVVVPTGDTIKFGLQNSGAEGDTSTFDNLSVRELAYPHLSFDGVDDYLSGSNPFTGDELTVIWCGKWRTAAAGTTYPFGMSDDVSNDNYCGLRRSSNGNLACVVAGTVGVSLAVAGGAAAGTDKMLAGFRLSSTLINAFKNSTSGAGTVTTPAILENAASISVGALNLPTWLGQGDTDCHYFFAVNKYLTDAELAQAKQFIANRCGVTL